MKYSYQDKVAIVTGASSGIGLVTARMLSERGARVVLAARSADSLSRLEVEIPNSLAIPVDVTRQEDVERMVGKTLERFGRIDILVNNAGVLVYKTMMETSEEEIRNVMEINYFGAVRCANAVLPVMLRQGGRKNRERVVGGGQGRVSPFGLLLREQVCVDRIF